MNLGSFLDPEYPIFSTTLCYLEREDAYLMLHRVKKQDDYNHDKWVGVGGKFERFESPEDCPDPLALPGAADIPLGQYDGVHPPLHGGPLGGQDDKGRRL